MLQTVGVCTSIKYDTSSVVQTPGIFHNVSEVCFYQYKLILVKGINSLMTISTGSTRVQHAHRRAHKVTSSTPMYANVVALGI